MIDRSTLYGSIGDPPAPTPSYVVPPPAPPIPTDSPFTVTVDGIEVTGSAYTLTARRGSTGDGVTTNLEAGPLLVTIDGATLTPESDPEVRPGRPLGLTLADGTPIMSATIARSSVTFPDKRDAAGTHRVTIEATDALARLARLPAPPTLPTGSLYARLAAILTPAGVDWTLVDPSGDTSTGPAIANPATTALEALRLVRDTHHAIAYPAKLGGVVVLADVARPDLTSHYTLSDTADPGDPDLILYTDLDIAFDSAGMVNVIEVKDATTTLTTLDQASVDEWGPQEDSVTVLDGDLGAHAARFLADRDTPRLTATSVTYNATSRPADAARPEIGDIVRVVRSGHLDGLHEVTSIEHTLTARRKGGFRWTVTLGLRIPSRVPLRWHQIPPAITWAAIPAHLTWDDLAAWRP